MGKKIGILLDIFLVFLFIQNSLLTGVPLSTAKLVIVFLLLRINLTQYFTFLLSSSFIRYVAFILIVLSLYHIINCTINSLPFTQLLYSFALFFFEFTIGSSILCFYLSSRYSYVEVCMIVLSSFLAQGIFLLAAFLLEPFRTLNSAVFTGESNIDFGSAIRVRGLGSNAGATLSYIQSFGGFWAMNILLDKRFSTWQKAYAVVALIIIFVSLIFVGRTGMVFILAYVLAGIVQLGVNSKSVLTPLKFIVTFVLAGIILANTYQYLLPYEVTENFDMASGRAFEVVENYQETGQISSKSSDHLLREMVFFPQTTERFVFGYGLWKDRMRVNSDLGIVQLMYAGGLVLVLVFYSVFLSISIRLLLNKLIPYFGLASLVLFFVFLVGEWKEPFSLKGMVVCNFMVIYFVHKLFKDRAERETD